MTKLDYIRRRKLILRHCRIELRELDEEWNKSKRRVPRRRTKGLSVYNAVRAVFSFLASAFTIHQVQIALRENDPILAGMIKRSSLATALARMGRAYQGFEIMNEGRGRRATVFRKLDGGLKEAVSPGIWQRSPAR
jgi:hypothetical protein